MRISIVGLSGRMGHAVASAIASRGHELAGGVSIGDSLDSLPDADCVIDFSNRAITADVASLCADRRMPLVIGTTGQNDDDLRAVEAAAATTPIFISANMSVGVALVADLARRAAAAFPDADVEIVERHHNKKVDVPSGTALMLARSIKEARPDVENVVGRHENGARKKSEIGIHSIRIGSDVGTHEIIIGTGSETITIRHDANSRDLFADGAVAAAEFIVGRPARLYSMRDLIAAEGGH